LTQKRRSDARRNRRHILGVAHRAFAEHGLDLPMREIVRRAEVGAATLYRHFPARQELLVAVLDEEVDNCERMMGLALEDPDPWRALIGTMHDFGDRQVRNRGLNEALVGSHSAGARFAGRRTAHAEALGVLVDRARADGALRQGVSVQDVRIALRAVASFRTHSLPRERAIIVTRRLADLLIAGIAATPDSANP
jgi:AcrR family transcriptional regulator